MSPSLPFFVLLPLRLTWACLLTVLACSVNGAVMAQVAPAQSAETVRMDVAASPQEVREVAGWGTAFVVAPGYLVTNAHVATGSLRLVDTDSGQRYAARVVALDEDNDLALLNALVPGSPLPLAAGEQVVALDRVFVLGYPDPARYGTSRKYASGRVRTPPISASGEPLTLFVSALPGNSGSPVCNEKGQVIGVVKGGLTKPLMKNGAPARSEPMPVAIPLAPLLALLQKHKVPYATYALSGPLDKVGEALAPSVYLVERTERPNATVIK